MSGGDDAWVGRVRGLVLGLALGDSVGRGAVPPAGPLLAGVSTQLAAFTIEGVIRAWVRGEHRGICHPPSVIWHAYCRWAALQGIETHERHRRWAAGTARWPDGRLADVPELRERRGSAPATVRALNRPEQGGIERPSTHSRGCHALTRSLPLAVLSGNVAPDALAELAQDVAALTHGDPGAYRTTAAAAILAGRCLTAGSLADAVASGPGLPRLPEVSEILDEARTVCAAARQAPRDRARLAAIAPDATARSALSGGLYVAASWPGPDEAVDPVDAVDALAFAATAPDGQSVAAVTGALLGALHGAGVWPDGLLGRLELGRIMDTLARDLVAQLTESPSGGAYGRPKDPTWLTRYPGW
ncbi:ADP-ribosylglycohydrolase family protein [Nonomuraea sp. NPDC003214]